MKKLLLLTTIFFSIQSVFSQNRFTPPSMKVLPPVDYNANSYATSKAPTNNSFFIAEKSKASLYAKEHYHLLEVNNDENKTLNFKLSAEKDNCNGNTNQIDIHFEFYDVSKSKKINNLSVSSKGSSKFYVKTNVPVNSKLSTFNCSNVVINDPIHKITKKLLIKTSIVDPKNAQ